MLIAAAICWIATACRAVISLQGPPRLWRWAFTASLFFLAAAVTAKAEAGEIDRLSAYNFATLTVHICAIAAAASGRIHLKTLRYESVPSNVIRRELALGVGVLTVAISSWLAAPVHGREMPNLVSVEQSPALLVFEFVFYFYLALTAAAVSRVNMLQIATAAGDSARQIGHGVIAATTALGSGVLPLWIARSAYRALYGTDLPLLSQIATWLGPTCVMGLSVGAVLFLTGPVVQDYRRAHRLLVDLEPLWLQLRRMQPQVVLRSRGGKLQPSAFRLERAMIEIEDALDATHVEIAGRSVFEDVAASIARPVAAGPFAAAVLPAYSSRAEEEESLRHLARCYVEEMQSGRPGDAVLPSRPASG